MKIIAHRGFSEMYPENTMLAFRKALDAGADGIETDLRLSRDDEVILFHDDNLRRITGFDSSPEKLTLAELKPPFPQTPNDKPQIIHQNASYSDFPIR